MIAEERTDVLPFRRVPGTVVLQPTPLCNMRCTYCYLPDLSDGRRMDVQIPKLLADQIARYSTPTCIELRWHAGEPLTTGRKHLAQLLEPFEALRRDGRVRHSLQTNATLVNDDWCSFFKQYEVDVGVSIDGPRWANSRRRTLSGAETFDRALRGIECLRGHHIGISVIAVVSLADVPRIVDQAADYLQFFVSIGAHAVGFNVEETEGRHRVGGDCRDTLVRAFWEALFAAWVDADCQPIVRDFAGILRFAEASLSGIRTTSPVDLLPTVTCDGDVVVLSPELAGYRDPSYDDFKAGNLYEETLDEILGKAPSLRYVREFREGARWCSDHCPYFSFCRAGQASNRYFEHGHFVTALTEFCQHSRRMPFDVVVGTPAWAPPESRATDD